MEVASAVGIIILAETVFTMEVDSTAALVIAVDAVSTIEAAPTAGIGLTAADSAAEDWSGLRAVRSAATRQTDIVYNLRSIPHKFV